jgi:glucose/arabinose dehydrogenase
LRQRPSCLPWLAWEPTFSQHVDRRVEAAPERLAKAAVRVYALGTHVVPLGLAYLHDGSGLPAPFVDGTAIGEHGSWPTTWATRSGATIRDSDELRCSAALGKTAIRPFRRGSLRPAK